jgi:hypothetical protein
MCDSITKSGTRCTRKAKINNKCLQHSKQSSKTIFQEITFQELINECKKIIIPKDFNVYLKHNEYLLEYKYKEDNLIVIKFSETEKIIGLQGSGVYLLKRIDSVEYTNYFPKNYLNGFRKPLWNFKHGFMFNKNDTTVFLINKLIFLANIINEKNYKLSEEYEPNKDSGIIGVNIEYEEPKWVTDIIPGNKLNNPIINNNIITFAKSGVTTLCLEKCIKFLRKYNKFKDLNDRYIVGDDFNELKNEFQKFIDSNFIVSLIGYMKHTRIVFKRIDSNKIILIDSWKQKEDKITKELKKTFYNLEFTKREKEQGNEGSCSAISLARSLFLSHLGVCNFDKKIPFDYIILASRIITKFR